MSGRDGQGLLSTWVPAELVKALKAQARTTDGGASAALRRLVAQAIGQAPAALHGAGRGEQVSMRFKASERAALAAAAEAHGTSPARWLRSLALVHSTDQPQWNPAELEALHDLFRELRAIGNNVNQIAHAANVNVQPARPLSSQGAAALEAMKLARQAMPRVVAVMDGSFAYWGRSEVGRQAAVPETARRVAPDVRGEEPPCRKRSERRAARVADQGTQAFGPPCCREGKRDRIGP